MGLVEPENGVNKIRGKAQTISNSPRVAVGRDEEDSVEGEEEAEVEVVAVVVVVDVVDAAEGVERPGLERGEETRRRANDERLCLLNLLSIIFASCGTFCQRADRSNRANAPTRASNEFDEQSFRQSTRARSLRRVACTNRR